MLLVACYTGPGTSAPLILLYSPTLTCEGSHPTLVPGVCHAGGGSRRKLLTRCGGRYTTAPSPFSRKERNGGAAGVASGPLRRGGCPKPVEPIAGCMLAEHGVALWVRTCATGRLVLLLSCVATKSLLVALAALDRAHVKNAVRKSHPSKIVGEGSRFYSNNGRYG